MKKYCEVNSNNILCNNFKEITLSNSINEVISILIDNVFLYIDNIHSIYIDGFDLYNDIDIESNPTLNFIIVLGSSESEYFYDHDRDGELQKQLSSLKNLVTLESRVKLNILLDINIKLESISFFKFDLLECRFISRFLWGKDLSLDKLDFNLVNESVLDGLEEEDHSILRKSREELILFTRYLDKERMQIIKKKIQNYANLLIRCAFNSVCRDIKVWTKDPYYCYYFFSKENPDLENISKQILDICFNYDKNVSEIIDILNKSETIIDRVVMKTEL